MARLVLLASTSPTPPHMHHLPLNAEWTGWDHQEPSPSMHMGEDRILAGPPHRDGFPHNDVEAQVPAGHLFGLCRLIWEPISQSGAGPTTSGSELETKSTAHNPQQMQRSKSLDQSEGSGASETAGSRVNLGFVRNMNFIDVVSYMQSVFYYRTASATSSNVLPSSKHKSSSVLGFLGF